MASAASPTASSSRSPRGCPPSSTSSWRSPRRARSPTTRPTLRPSRAAAASPSPRRAAPATASARPTRPTPTSAPTTPYPTEGIAIANTGTISGIPRRVGSFTVHIHTYSALVPNERGQHLFADYQHQMAPAAPLLVDYSFTLEGTQIAGPVFNNLPEFQVGQSYNPDGGGPGLQFLASGGVGFDELTDAPHADERGSNFQEVAGHFTWTVDWDPVGQNTNAPPGIELLNAPAGATFSDGALGVTNAGIMQRQGRQVAQWFVEDHQLPLSLRSTNSLFAAFSVGPDKAHHHREHRAFYGYPQRHPPRPMKWTTTSRSARHRCLVEALPTRTLSRMTSARPTACQPRRALARPRSASCSRVRAGAMPTSISCGSWSMPPVGGMTWAACTLARLARSTTSIPRVVARTTDEVTPPTAAGRVRPRVASCRTATRSRTTRTRVCTPTVVGSTPSTATTASASSWFAAMPRSTCPSRRSRASGARLATGWSRAMPTAGARDTASCAPRTSR